MPTGNGCAIGKGHFIEEKKAESLHHPPKRIVRTNEDVQKEVRLT